MSAHHFSELEHIYSQVRTALKPGGFFVLYEYIGPTQFQWTDKQLAIINDLLKILPAKYREYIPFPGQIKQHIQRPTIDGMNSIDPSEAIRSAEIVPLLAQYFNIVERIDYGGTILHMLLQDIVGNFDVRKEEDIAILNLICYLEETLIKKNVLPSDFALIISQNNDKAQTPLISNTARDDQKNINSIQENYQDNVLSDIPSQQIAQQIPIRRLIKAIGYKVMAKFRLK
jgi:SAM-dependent methyltransferase